MHCNLSKINLLKKFTSSMEHPYAPGQAIVETLAAFAAPLYRAFASWNDYFGLVYCIYATITVIVLVIALHVVRYFRRHKV